jgi:hypothetical protein
MINPKLFSFFPPECFVFFNFPLYYSAVAYHQNVRFLCLLIWNNYWHWSYSSVFLFIVLLFVSSAQSLVGYHALGSTLSTFIFLSDINLLETWQATSLYDNEEQYDTSKLEILNILNRFSERRCCSKSGSCAFDVISLDSVSRAENAFKFVDNWVSVRANYRD